MKSLGRLISILTVAVLLTGISADNSTEGLLIVRCKVIFSIKIYFFAQGKKVKGWLGMIGHQFWGEYGGYIHGFCVCAFVGMSRQ